MGTLLSLCAWWHLAVRLLSESWLGGGQGDGGKAGRNLQALMHPMRVASQAGVSGLGPERRGRPPHCGVRGISW